MKINDCPMLAAPELPSNALSLAFLPEVYRMLSVAGHFNSSHWAFNNDGKSNPVGHFFSIEVWSSISLQGTAARQWMCHHEYRSSVQALLYR